MKFLIGFSLVSAQISLASPIVHCQRESSIYKYAISYSNFNNESLRIKVRSKLTNAVVFTGHLQPTGTYQEFLSTSLVPFVDGKFQGAVNDQKILVKHGDRELSCGL